MCIQGCELHAGLNARPRPPPRLHGGRGNPVLEEAPTFF